MKINLNAENRKTYQDLFNRWINRKHEIKKLKYGDGVVEKS